MLASSAVITAMMLAQSLKDSHGHQPSGQYIWTNQLDQTVQQCCHGGWTSLVQQLTMSS